MSEKIEIRFSSADSEVEASTENSGWTKVPAYTGTVHRACLCCPPVEPKAPMGMLIAVGFGSATAERDGKIIYQEGQSNDFHVLQDFEDMAAADPDHDWRVTLFGPLRGRVYQRQGQEEWVLIESSQGFCMDDE